MKKKKKKLTQMKAKENEWRNGSNQNRKVSLISIENQIN